jgi:hypothetical protein
MRTRKISAECTFLCATLLYQHTRVSYKAGTASQASALTNIYAACPHQLPQNSVALSAAAAAALRTKCSTQHMLQFAHTAVMKDTTAAYASQRCPCLRTPAHDSCLECCQCVQALLQLLSHTLRVLLTRHLQPCDRQEYRDTGFNVHSQLFTGITLHRVYRVHS